MDDDLDSKISQIMGVLKNHFSSDSPSSSDDKGDGGNDARATNTAHEEKFSGFDMPDDTLKMVMKMKQLMDGQKRQDDPAKNLLYAIKPFLKESRQEKVGQCVKFMGMSKMAKYADLFSDK